MITGTDVGSICVITSACERLLRPPWKSTCCSESKSNMDVNICTLVIDFTCEMSLFMSGFKHDIISLVLVFLISLWSNIHSVTAVCAPAHYVVVIMCQTDVWPSQLLHLLDQITCPPIMFSPFNPKFIPPSFTIPLHVGVFSFNVCKRLFRC